MNRNEKILQYINKDGRGIEIGPSHRPSAPKKEGYNVHIIDHMSREDLIKKYKGHAVNLENIENVDFIWRGEKYSELTGKQNYYDWIIASHVIEHTPDLISFLSDCATVLKDDGVFSLVIPDKRYCFDHYRPITGISRVIDLYYQKNRVHSPGTMVEYYLNVVSKAGNIAWTSNTAGKYRFVHSLENARHGLKSMINENAYLDFHAWCFTPHSFRLIIHDLFSLGLIPFKEIGFYPTKGCEFFVTLGKNGQGLDKSRMEMLEIIEFELMNKEAQLCQAQAPENENIIKRISKSFIKKGG